MPVRTLSNGRRCDAAALPDDPDLMLGCFRMAQDLLGFLANRIEPTRDLAEKAEAETLRLHELQAAIVSRIAARPALDAADVLRKLQLWRAARDLADEADALDCEDRLVVSAMADLEALHAQTIDRNAAARQRRRQ